MSARPARRRIGAGLAAAITAVTGVAFTAAPAAADPPAPTATSSAVTLITGDVAVVDVAADGTTSASLTTTSDYYTRMSGGDVYVIPVEAEAMLAAGTLDPELFNVTGLVRSGYDDAHRDDIPLITTGPTPRTAGLSSTGTLSSIGATAVTVDKGEAGDVFDSFGRSRSSSGRIWLDARVTGFDLDPTTGVEQTGADEAWDLGFDGEGTTVAILDTGVDADHPDLAGRITASQDFTGGGNPSDHDGHGTHVAATVAGTGEASDGSRAGMAPGADLVVGKVLGVGGGQASWIIAGMEWAVAQGADVVNMSLGTNVPTDCTDPIAEATRALTEQDDTLFVLAAGNAGLRETVTSPGCVETVLTVGAVDADSQTASFSSRGPTLGDLRVKPDIAAPGVAITSAYAGSPGGNHYRQMSGTSMAAPHVAGAAALVRQAHPEWGARQIKEALTSSVKPDATGTVYEQGSGELWVPGAIESTVQATASVKVGGFLWPHSGTETARSSITYTNSGDENVKLSLKVTDLVGANGGKMPKTALQVAAKKVTVPAGGSVTVPVVVTDVTRKVSADSFGEISARIVATGKGVQVTTAVGYWLEPETAEITVKVTDRAGQPAASGFLDVFHMDEDRFEGYYFNGQDVVLRARVGTVSISGFVRSASGADKSYTYVGDPEIEITGDTTLRFDARDATRIKVTTEQASQARAATLHYTRNDERWLTLGSVYSGDTDVAMYALPTEGKVKKGDFGFGSFWRMYADGVATEASPFVYNLGFTETGKVGARQRYDVADADLATVSESFYAQREAGTYFDTIKTLSAANEQVFVGTGMQPVTTPAERTAYYSAGIPFQQMGIGNDSRLGADMMFDPFRVYEAGETRETVWNRLPTNTGVWTDLYGAPGRIAERQGDLMGFSFAPFKDSEGRYGLGGFGDVGNLRFFENGELVGENAWPNGQVVVSGDPSTRYEVQVTQFRMRMLNGQLPGTHIGLATQSVFGFDSERPAGESVAALPILMPTYDIPVDGYNLVPAEGVTPVTVGFTGQDGFDPGEIVSFTAQVYYDEIDLMAVESLAEYDWADVEVEYRDGAWRALVDNTGHAGAYPSLHITATDADGNSVDQYVVRLYGVA
ncbi:subtilisin family serine protease [Stackebrandtia albiflava]|uniref:Subtilisin family serine protease n=1 Tax=Stackebrandtia albiflava TaxID=406432 RepID=A0A562V205_9ACTN|nr:S8 family serine peptidase [Stackebrandtia albiflava]TWJ11842.1 subtilisin family serine protease [Stackebrandtia albiflava]